MNAKRKGTRNTPPQFQIGSRVRLACAPEWTGEVIAHEADAVLVQFTIGEQIATERHSANALDIVGKGQAA